MKKSALNLLWQQKRNDLPIDENQQADWAEMNQLLNKHMPVSTGTVATQPLFKTILVHIAKFKLFFTLATLLVAGTAAYFFVDHSTTVQTKPHDHSKIKANNRDLQNSPANNLAVTDSVTNKTIVDDNNAVTNGAEKSLLNKNKAPIPDNHTSSGTSNTASGGTKTAGGINNSENKILSLANNGKSNISKRSSLNNSISSLSADENRSTSSSGRIDVVSKLGSNHSHRSNSRINFNNSVSRIVDRNDTQGDVHKTGVSGPGTGRPANPGLPNYALYQQKQDIVQLLPSQLFSWDTNTLLIKNTTSKLPGKILEGSPIIKASTSPKIKNKKGWTLPIDWGLLAGINSPGSFTSATKKATNGVPFDVYLGLFASYDLNDKWSVNLQARLPSPHLARGNYSHAEEGKTDTTGTQTVNSKILDSRKMYMVDIPLHLVYRVSPNIGIKGGPVLSIPLTDANGISTVTTSGTLKDSVAYFYKMSEALNNTKMERKIYYGVSGGVSLNYGRLLLDATFYHNFQAQKVSSTLGGYTSNNNSLQIAIGFRLNKKRQ
jgi:hypothetical protein